MLIENSVVTDFFKGQTQTIIQCWQCKNQSYCFDCFMDVQLCLPAESQMDLTQLLKDFIRKQTLSEYRCENKNCKERRNHQHQMQFMKLPKVLVFHFKRF